MKTAVKSKRKNTLTQAICFRHIQKYSQYAQNSRWAMWYARVAPLKAKRIITTLLAYKNTQAKILDVGCGTGMTFALLAQTFPFASALDIGDQEIKATKELLAIIGITAPVIKYDGDRIPFPSNSFDVITSIEVIEHVQFPNRMLKEMKRVLKKDGVLHITTANKWWPIEPHFKLPFLSYLPAKLADSYVRFTKRGTSYHNIRLPSYLQFKTMVERYFIVKDITLDVLRNYKSYGMEKERGAFIVLIGTFLKFLSTAKRFPGASRLINFIEFLLLNASLGWLFIATPKK